jgi:hypothetical protein
MDIVYICRSGKNEELRYSIRSVVKNLPHDNIWVVGQKPNWYTGNFIPVKDTRMKYTNARNNLKALATNNDISKDFILMNDDFFIFKKIDELQYFYTGLLQDKALRFETFSASGAYTRMLYSTLEKLQELGIKDPLDYELHVPMIMNREKLLNVLKVKNTLWRSIYGNLYSVAGKQMPDVKVYALNNRHRQSFDWENNLDYFLSTQDATFENIKAKLLVNEFPLSSVYESVSLS